MLLRKNFKSQQFAQQWAKSQHNLKLHKWEYLKNSWKFGGHFYTKDVSHIDIQNAPSNLDIIAPAKKYWAKIDFLRKSKKAKIKFAYKNDSILPKFCRKYFYWTQGSWIRQGNFDLNLEIGNWNFRFYLVPRGCFLTIWTKWRLDQK